MKQKKNVDWGGGGVKGKKKKNFDEKIGEKELITNGKIWKSKKTKKKTLTGGGGI